MEVQIAANQIQNDEVVILEDGEEVDVKEWRQYRNFVKDELILHDLSVPVWHPPLH